MQTEDQPAAGETPGRPAKHRLRRSLVVVGIIVLLLIAARVALPFVLRDAINHRLEKIPGYTGRVADVGLSLYRGAYSLHDLEITRRDGAVQEPFFKAREIDFSVAWRELFHGRIVSDISFDRAELNFVRGPSDATTQLAADKRWQEVINDLFPIDITYLKITESRLRFIDTTNDPKVDVEVAHLTAVATGLRNRAETAGDEFPARIDLRGETVGGGALHLFTHLEPLATQPHFLLKLEIENVSLPALNDFLRAYGNVDVRAGTFKGYLEMVARNGKFEGYFKPFFENVDFRDAPGQEKPLGTQIWEGVVRFFTFAFKNHQRDQVATRIPFSGEFGRPEFSGWQTFVNVLRHAFVRPWPERLESRTAPAGEAPDGKKAAAPPAAAKPGN